MSTKVWLDLTMYGIRLFVNLDQVNKVNHGLVVAGPKIEAHRITLASLGFVRDNRFTNEYWVRPLKGVTPKLIHEVFPRSFMREMPLEEVMPALAAKSKSAAKKTDQSKESLNDTQLENARNLSVDADGSHLDAGAPESPLLGKDDSRNPDGGKSREAKRARQQQPAGKLPEAAAGSTLGGSAEAGEAVAQPESVGPRSELLPENELAEPLQAVRAGSADRRLDEESGGVGKRVLEQSYLGSELVPLAGHIQARITGDESLFDMVGAPQRWLLMNAARPLLGHKTYENGPFLAGRFYAAIDPDDSVAERYIEANKNLDARVVVTLTEHEQIDLALWDSEYASRYREEFEGEELYRVLQGQISDLNKLTFAELQSLRVAVAAAASESNLNGDDVSGGVVSEETIASAVDDVSWMIKIAADDIGALRVSDVHRVMSQASSLEQLNLLSDYITNHRHDLANEAAEVGYELRQENGWGVSATATGDDPVPAISDAAEVVQPWQMTQAEWNSKYRQSAGSIGRFTRNAGNAQVAQLALDDFLRYGVRDWASQRMAAAMKGEITLTPEELEAVEDRLQSPVTHRDVIEKALAEGKPVPGHVMADYPGLGQVQRPVEQEASEPAATDETADDIHAEVKRLFGAGRHEEAYAAFRTDPSANKLTLTEFVEAMHASAGGPEAAMRLSPSQRSELSKAGAGNRAIEFFATTTDLNEAFTTDRFAANVLASVMEDREKAIHEALIMEGWLPGESESEVVGERSAFWNKDGNQLWMLLDKKGWQYSGNHRGQVLPLFAVTDDFSRPVGDVLEQIKSECGEHFGVTPKASETQTSDTSPASLEDEKDPVEIDRVWRGSTYAHIEAGQSANRYFPTSIFTALETAEKYGIPRDDWKMRVSLAEFMGWGGITKQVRTDSRTKSKNSSGETIAKSLGMDSGEFNSLLLQNRLESYYTAAPISGAIWSIIQRAGVSPHGRYLEPGCGAGLFYATAPEDVQRHGRLVGVECDPIAVRVAKVTVPDVTLVEQRYERAALDRNFDAVIGNVPFGETIITDDRYPKATHIHDYFIVRSLDHLKPGGIMAVITSSGTLDKKDSSVRQQIMARANLVAALRLPVEAFGNQGASVTTDILLLQRRPDGTMPDYDFTQTYNQVLVDGDGESHEFSINSYFADHPANVLGVYKVESSAFGPKLCVRAPHITEKWREYGVLKAIGEEIAEAVNRIVPAGIAQRTDWPKAEIVRETKSFEVPDDVALLDSYQGYVGDMTVIDGKVVEVIDIIDQFDDDGIRVGKKYLAAPLDVTGKAKRLLVDYIGLRDAARALIAAQLSGTDELLTEAQATAKTAYDAFVDAWGPVNAASNVKAFGDDAGSAEVCALEVWNDEEMKVVALADAFTKRVVRPTLDATATNAQDAYFVSIDRKGVPDLAFMSELSGISEDDLLKELLGKRVFFDPANGGLVRADQYLSGNVVRKLEEARQASELNDQYVLNVDALTAVQPVRIPFQDITINLGANWIPPEDIREFVGSLLNANLKPGDFTARYVREGGFWSVDVSGAFKRDYQTQRDTLFGTKNASMETLLEKLLNKQKPTHTYKDDDGKTRTDEKATLESRNKQDELNDQFYRWVAALPERAERYTTLYNASTNVMRTPEVDGSQLTFPGLAPTWHPRDHQKNMVAMGMLGFNVMAAHAVGAGKTFEMVAMAMKLKQIGMVSKPMIAVPNHMLGQISREAKQMYPGARLLMVTADDLRGSKRKRFLAMARNNDWDMVVCTHSMLNGISAPLDIVLEEHDRHIRVLQSKLAETDNARLERQLSAKIKTAESKRDAAEELYLDEERLGRLLTLDQLGVDSLQVDEAHLYKNLDLESSMNVLGITTAGSNRAFNMWTLGQYLKRLHGKSFGLNFYTGTPVANSMCELYVHNKMLRNDLLEDMGISHFDEWASRFGDVVSNLEALPEGGGFRVNERFARFVNLPEMLRVFRTFADVKTKEQMNLPRPKLHSHAIAVEQSEWQSAFMKHLAIRAVAVRKGKVKPEEDNMLSIASAGRKAALDMRLVAPELPDDSAIKLDTVASNIHRLWELHGDVKATQLVFIDLGTPGKNKEFSTYTYLKDRLIELGVPANDVAFIHDAKNNDAKEALFAQVRSGEKRVLIGSTEKMGVGTNVQERMCALHNVDCPWRPADIEQRIGRIDRQGNLYFSEVDEYRYTTQDSFDLFMWETNKRKATFIAQALSDPNSAGRDVSEEMDMGYAEVMAVTTGNPKIREKVETDDKVVKLERKDRAWFGDRMNKLSAEHYLRHDISRIERWIEEEKNVQAMLPKATFKSVTVNGTITGLQDGDTTWLYATELGTALLSRTPLVEAKLMRFNEREMTLNAYVGDIELIGVLDNRTDHGQMFIQGRSPDGTIIPVNSVALSKNPQVVGRGVREWFDSPNRLKKHRDDMMIKQRGLDALGDLDALRSASSPYEAELEAMKTVKAELDGWFAAQDFDKLGDGPDPYLEMLAEYRAGLRDDQVDDLEPLAIEDCASDEGFLQDELFTSEAHFEPDPSRVATPAMR
ncbi:N-6 DNA methylase (plasmid) [Stutzerimonas frequens]|nr:N-6 DNA methylase [Stutzerimonas frequens]WRW29264.1 N-6 DNA methylase [Stutzerimonas frequens]